MVVANFTDATFSLLLGDGQGGFSGKTDFFAGTGNPISVTSLDFNGDNNIDVVVANYNSSLVWVHLGNGSGGFTSGGSFPVGSNPISVFSADFNGDNLADIAVANQASGSVSVLLGNGSGGVFSNSVYLTGSNAQSVNSADFNGDGKLDLAVANWGAHTVSILYGNGLGGFPTKTNYSTGFNPQSVASADFNGDGLADIAVSNQNTNNVSVFLSLGLSGFASKNDYATGNNAVSVTSADLNGDGNYDLAVANYNSNTVSVLLGDGAGNFPTKVDFSSVTNPISVISADFNGNGNLDLAIANLASNDVGLLNNQSLAISTISLVNGTVNAAYSQTLAATGGISPYTWSFIAGGLPNSIQLISNTGVISGNPVPTTAGISNFTVQVTDNSSATASKVLSITITKANQSISFTPPASGTISGSATLSASVTSGFTVSFSSSTTGVCTVSGTTVSYIALGTCTLNANQAGDADYNAAPQVSVNITVSKIAQALTFAPTGTANVGGSATLSATSDSALAVTAFGSSTPSVCTVTGTGVTYDAAGTCTLTADQAGNGTYLAATQATANVTVSLAAQTITFTAAGTGNVGNTATLSASSDSTLVVALGTSSAASVCTVSGNIVTYVGLGTCTLTADQAGNGTYAAATQVTADISVLAAGSTTGVVTGNGSVTDMNPVKLTFGVISGTGFASYVAKTGTSTGVSLPGMTFGTDDLVYDVLPGVGFTGTVEVCITYDPTQFPTKRGLRLVHLNHVTGLWENITTTHNKGANQICGNTTSFSHFGVAHVNSTFVSLSAFDAVVNTADEVLLHWATDLEVDHYAFELVREDVATDERAVLNTQTGKDTAGGDYQYIDSSAIAGNAYRYTLVNIDIRGKRAEHGPLSLTVDAGSTFIFDPQSNATAVTLSHATPTTGGGAMSLFNLLALLMFVPLIARRKKH